jgi:hypothetical protein
MDDHDKSYVFEPILLYRYVDVLDPQLYRLTTVLVLVR